MPTLELLLDASGMQRGAQQAQTALRTVQTEATATEAKVVGTARQMGQGMLQATSGIVGAATSFGQLNAASGLFQSSRVLLDIGNMATGFRALTVAGTGLRGVISGIGLAISANPLGALATVLSTVALGMGLFGSSTEKATQAIREQNRELGSLFERIPKLQAGARFGAADPRTTTSGAVEALTALTLSDRGSFNAKDMASLFGVSEYEFRQALAIGGRQGERAVEGEPSPLSTPFNRMFSYNEVSFGREATIGAGEYLLQRRRLRETEQSFYMRNADGLGPVGGDPYDRATADELYGNQRPGGGVRITAERQAQVNQENTERALRAMDELVAKGEQFGATIGNAFFNVASGTQTARQALQSLIADFARLASQQAFARFFGTAFGATAPQQNSNGGGFFSG